MANKTYTWPFNLHENAMTKDDQTDYLASVRILRTLTVEDIADGIVADRTEYRRDTIINISRLVENKIREMVYEGYRVQTELARFSPSITGIFNRAGDVDPKLHKGDINITPTAEFREGLAHVKLVHTGRVRDKGGAEIINIIDLMTRQANAPFTRTSVPCLRGRKIKCLNADGTGVGRLVLTNCATKEEFPVDRILENYPTRLTFQFPPDLPAGDYWLRIETYYTTNPSLLKKIRYITYPKPLTLIDA